MISFSLLFILLFFAAAVLAPGIVLIILGIKAGGKKRVLALIIPFAIIFTLTAGAAKIYYDFNHTIGTFSGSEFDTITIKGVSYKADYSNTFSGTDKKKLLGKTVYSGTTDNTVDPMYVWSIKGTEEYIYAVSDFDGTIYKRITD